MSLLHAAQQQSAAAPAAKQRLPPVLNSHKCITASALGAQPLRHLLRAGAQPRIQLGAGGRGCGRSQAVQSPGIVITGADSPSPASAPAASSAPPHRRLPPVQLQDACPRYSQALNDSQVNKSRCKKGIEVEAAQADARAQQRLRHTAQPSGLPPAAGSSQTPTHSPHTLSAQHTLAGGLEGSNCALQLSGGVLRRHRDTDAGGRALALQAAVPRQGQQYALPGQAVVHHALQLLVASRVLQQGRGRARQVGGWEGRQVGRAAHPHAWLQ